MLDFDLAVLYLTETRVLNQAVRRNKEYFPPDFIFQLTSDELENLKSQFVISSFQHGGRRHLPNAFTEQGIAVLSSVLNSKRAVEMNIAIMRAFVLHRNAEISPALATRFDQLETRLERIEKYMLTNTATTVRTTLSTTDRPAHRPIEAILDRVAKYYALKPSDLKSPIRKKKIALPRQVAMYLVRKWTGLSFSDIGSYFGGKDHTTVLHAYRKIETELKKSDFLREEIDAIQSKL